MIRWASGIPAEEGWYLCANDIAEEYIYWVVHYDGFSWGAFGYDEQNPRYHQKIVSPAEEMKRLDQMLNEIKNAQ